jgi:hypothetical protein
MDTALVALIAPVWNSMADGQDAVLLGILLACFANLVVLFNMTRLLFVHPEYVMNAMRLGPMSPK